jgi:hypothetical protein
VPERDRRPARSRGHRSHNAAEDNSILAVTASLNPTALFLVGFLALVVNIVVFVYHFAKVLKYKRNVAVGVHSDLGEYQALAAERLRPGTPDRPTVHRLDGLSG